jgi:hypothetical protein
MNRWTDFRIQDLNRPSQFGSSQITFFCNDPGQFLTFIFCYRITTGNLYQLSKFPSHV